MSHGFQSEHRVASYNKGCRCGDCRKAKRDAARRIRAMHRRARGVRPGDVCCPLCGAWIHPLGAAAHERTHDDD